MKLHFSIVAAVVVSTTGCAQIALYHDRQDMCQVGAASEARRIELGRPEGYRAPDYCRSGTSRSATTNFYNTSGVRIGTAVTRY
jgi:hypothetical protein